MPSRVRQRKTPFWAIYATGLHDLIVGLKRQVGISYMLFACGGLSQSKLSGLLFRSTAFYESTLMLSLSPAYIRSFTGNRSFLSSGKTYLAGFFDDGCSHVSQNWSRRTQNWFWRPQCTITSPMFLFQLQAGDQLPDIWAFCYFGWDVLINCATITITPSRADQGKGPTASPCTCLASLCRWYGRGLAF